MYKERILNDRLQSASLPADETLSLGKILRIGVHVLCPWRIWRQDLSAIIDNPVSKWCLSLLGIAPLSEVHGLYDGS